MSGWVLYGIGCSYKLKFEEGRVEIITGGVISRWTVTVMLLLLACVLLDEGYSGLIVCIAVVATVMSEVYWYLWQKEKRRWWSVELEE